MTTTYTSIMSSPEDPYTAAIRALMGERDVSAKAEEEAQERIHAIDQAITALRQFQPRTFNT